MIMLIQLRMALYFLKAYGLEPLIDETVKYDEENQATEVIFDENMKMSVVRQNKISLFLSKWLFRYPINWIYRSFIFIVLLWPIIYGIVNFFITFDISYITTILFHLLFLLQYVYGIIYFRKTHFKEALSRYKLNNKITFVFIITLIVPIFVYISTMMLIVFEQDTNIYSEIWNKIPWYTQIVYGFVLFINVIYSYGLLMTNMIAFFTVFWFHSKEVDKFTKNLDGILDNDSKEFSLSQTMQEFSELKNYHRNSVLILNNIFSSLVVVGIVSFSFVSIQFESNLIGYINLFDLLFFVIVVGIYVYSINKVRSSILDIKNLINNPKYVTKFLPRTELADFVVDDKEKSKDDTILTIIKNINRNVYRSLIKDNENSTNIDWLIMMEKLECEWEPFQVFGFDVNDSTLFKKMIAVLFGIIIVIYGVSVTA